MINTEPEVELVPKYLVGREILSYPVLKKNVDIIPVVCPFESCIWNHFYNWKMPLISYSYEAGVVSSALPGSTK